MAGSSSVAAAARRGPASAIMELAPLVSYLALVVYLICRTWPLLGYGPPAGALIFAALALFSLGLTWTHMYRFIAHSAREHMVAFEGLWTPEEWLRDTSLFKQAWDHVCSTIPQWWWSSQICLVTAGVWTPILFAEARHQLRLAPPSLLQQEFRLKPRSLMLTGQLVAISFASAHSFASTILSSAVYPPRRRAPAPISLVIAVLGGLALTAYTPSTVGTSAFLPVLLGLHALLFWPILSPAPASGGVMELSTLYMLSALASGALGLMNTNAAMAEVRNDIRTLLAVAFRAHPAQASISYDVVCVTVVMFAWLVAETLRTPTMRGDVRAWGVLGVAIACTPVLGIASTAAGYLALVELERLDERPDETSVASWRTQ